MARRYTKARKRSESNCDDMARFRDELETDAASQEDPRSKEEDIERAGCSMAILGVALWF